MKKIVIISATALLLNTSTPNQAKYRTAVSLGLFGVGCVGWYLHERNTLIALQKSTGDGKPLQKNTVPDIRNIESAPKTTTLTMPTENAKSILQPNSSEPKLVEQSKPSTLERFSPYLWYGLGATAVVGGIWWLYTTLSKKSAEQTRNKQQESKDLTTSQLFTQEYNKQLYTNKQKSTQAILPLELRPFEQKKRAPIIEKTQNNFPVNNPDNSLVLPSSQGASAPMVTNSSPNTIKVAQALKILGFTPGANPTERDIDSAFRKLAKGAHPDANPENKPIFLDLSKARNVLLGQKNNQNKRHTIEPKKPILAIEWNPQTAKMPQELPIFEQPETPATEEKTAPKPAAEELDVKHFVEETIDFQIEKKLNNPTLNSSLKALELAKTPQEKQHKKTTPKTKSQKLSPKRNPLTSSIIACDVPQDPKFLQSLNAINNLAEKLKTKDIERDTFKKDIIALKTSSVLNAELRTALYKIVWANKNWSDIIKKKINPKIKDCLASLVETISTKILNNKDNNQALQDMLGQQQTTNNHLVNANQAKNKKNLQKTTFKKSTGEGENVSFSDVQKAIAELPAKLQAI